MTKTREIIKDSRYLLIAFGFTVFAAFFVGIFLEYAFSNDYSVFMYENSKCCNGYPESRHYFWIGRPIAAVLLNIQFMFIDQISDFGWLRFVSFLLFLSFAFAIYVQFIREANDRPKEAFLSSLCLILLPAPILYIAWSLTGTYFISLILVTVSYHLVFDSYKSNIIIKHRRIIAGYALLLLTFFIYPPISYFFLVFTCWRALMTDKLKDRIWLMRSYAEIAMVGVISLIYFILLKVVSTPEFLGLFFVGVGSPPPGNYAVGLADNLLKSLISLQEFTHFSLNMWFEGLFSNKITLVFGITLLFSFIFSQIRMAYADGERRNLLSIFGGISIPLASFLLSASPMVISVGGFTLLRNAFVGSSILCLILISCIFSISRIVNKPKIGLYLAVILSIAALLLGSYRLTLSAVGNHLELSYIKRVLLNSKSNIDNGVVIYQSKGSSPSLSSSLLSKEFALSTNTYDHIMQGMVRGALKDITPDYRNVHVTTAGDYSHMHIAGSPVEICSNISGLMGIQKAATQSTCYIKPSLSNEVNDGWITLYDMKDIGILKAFDKLRGKYAGVWETSILEPVIFDIAYQTPQILLSYIFHAGVPDIDRLPSEWEILGSNDGKNWVGVDIGLDKKLYSPNEKREYFIKSPRPYKNYRWIFKKSNNPGILRIWEIDLKYRSPKKDKK